MKSSTTVSQTTPSSRIEEGPEPEDHLALGLGSEERRIRKLSPHCQQFYSGQCMASMCGRMQPASASSRALKLSSIASHLFLMVACVLSRLRHETSWTFPPFPHHVAFPCMCGRAQWIGPDMYCAPVYGVVSVS
jgi:hypothetical protein